MIWLGSSSEEEMKIQRPTGDTCAHRESLVKGQQQERDLRGNHLSPSWTASFQELWGNAFLSFKLTHLSRAVPVNRRRQWHPLQSSLPGKSHGRRSLVGCSPLGREESDTTEWLPFHFSLSCIGEGNGNPLQCSCLENPRVGGAWWAAVYGVAQSQTRLKRLSSSSSSSKLIVGCCFCC